MSCSIKFNASACWGDVLDRVLSDGNRINEEVVVLLLLFGYALGQLPALIASDTTRTPLSLNRTGRGRSRTPGWSSGAAILFLLQFHSGTVLLREWMSLQFGKTQGEVVLTDLKCPLDILII
jgi:hypothetical protein